MKTWKKAIGKRTELGNELTTNLMEDHYITFQKFNLKSDAQFLKENLEQGDINVIIEDVSASVDITFSGSTAKNQFLLKIKQSDFDKADKVLEAQAEKAMEEFSDDHYLYEFSDDELREIFEKPDEWSKEDYLLSRKILAERGHVFSREHLENLKAKRLTEIRAPEKAEKNWIVVGYIFAVLGGLLGLWMGWAYWKSTKIDPTGLKIYVYDSETRKSGRSIFMIGSVIFILEVILMVRNQL